MDLEGHVTSQCLVGKQQIINYVSHNYCWKRRSSKQQWEAEGGGDGDAAAGMRKTKTEEPVNKFRTGRFALIPDSFSLLPADLNLELNKELPTGYVINNLITFLERQLTAREKINKHPKTRFYNEKPITTASELFYSVHKSNECVFCGKDNHGSPKCDFAANLSLKEKRSLMRKKKCVFYKCLRPSHLSNFFINVVHCSICNLSSHLYVMCTKQILNRGRSYKSPTVQDETLANLSTSSDVLLPTLRVTLKENRTDKTARAIIDT
ncbi:hypothetical protein LAZ67_7000889 [Cordylochernes scorpioides]|uniref:Uncharacterized protein n=1 Tax=Cordylochernes scorpioides TaxID=51811 RepID=A0ABY6KLS5_9ARAC|nr:hypothetical protein LAZ67_7000889 [Cordylochernes scorpioides]